MKHVILCLFLMSLCATAFAQNELPKGYYVVVAAYKSTSEGYAKRYADQLKLKGHDAHYGLNSTRKLYLVYVKYETDRAESLEEMRNARQKGEFPDAWVKVIKDSSEQQVTLSNLKADPVKEEDTNNPKIKTEVPPVEQKEKETPVAEVKETPTETVKEEIKADSIKEEPKPLTTSKVKSSLPAENMKVVFNLVYTTKNENVDGEVQIIDTDRSTLIEKLKGNRYVVLPDPKSKSDQLTLIADVFGYRKVQHEIKYPLTPADTAQDFITRGDSALIITFDLIRYHKGDIQTLYNVYFYNDAVIMLPESKYELNSLVQMMQENPNLRIRLHGHSNGNHSGKILGLGPNKNFFDMEGTIQGQGSAKELSGQRAGAIKEYLIANGIAADRVEVKAWGGRKPIYDKHSVNAKKNVRVEVEILND